MMKRCMMISAGLMLALFIVGSGCARAAKDTSGFSLRSETVVNASFEETWHTVKHVLREQGYDIYTRDKRGAFVAYTPMGRALWLQPRRTKFSIEMARLSNEDTAIAIDSIRQIYGVTLLTHPGWHDRKHSDPAASEAILDGIRMKISEGDLDPESFIEEMPEAEPTQDAPGRPAVEEAPLPAEHAPIIEEAETVN